MTNPPYGLRMMPDDLKSIHTTLFTLIGSEGMRGGFVTGYDATACCPDHHSRTQLVLKNGSEDVTFWKKKE